MTINKLIFDDVDNGSWIPDTGSMYSVYFINGQSEAIHRSSFQFLISSISAIKLKTYIQS